MFILSLLLAAALFHITTAVLSNWMFSNRNPGVDDKLHTYKWNNTTDTLGNICFYYAEWVFAWKYWLVASKLNKFAYPNAKSTKKCNVIFNLLMTAALFISQFVNIIRISLKTEVFDAITTGSLIFPIVFNLITVGVLLVALYNCWRAL